MVARTRNVHCCRRVTRYVTLIFHYSLHLLQSGNNHKQREEKTSNGEPVGVVLSNPIRHRCAAANLSWRTWRSGVTETFKVAWSARTCRTYTPAFITGALTRQ